MEETKGPSAKCTRSYIQDQTALMPRPWLPSSSTVSPGGQDDSWVRRRPGPPVPWGARGNPETFTIPTPQTQTGLALAPGPGQQGPRWPMAQKGEFMPNLVSNCSFCRFW